MTNTTEVNKDVVQALFEAGSHFGYTKSKRHPSTSKYIFGTKEKVDIFDLEKVSVLLSDAKEFVKKLASEGKNVLFVGGKREVLRIIKDSAIKIEQPYVSGRWIGGTLTNFEEIQKRTSRYEDIIDQKEKGLLAKYTKKERLLLDREVDKLENRFGGIVSMKKKPAALFIIDADHEEIAVLEAKKIGIPVISLCSSDCNIKNIDYPIVANDSSVKSISYIVNEILASYEEGIRDKKVSE
ncbi:MAG: small subunit ribosomal protein S2 [Candidatus Paceibacteria bacterium]|jgi:small subunit ribosomal protein S2